MLRTKLKSLIRLTALSSLLVVGPNNLPSLAAPPTEDVQNLWTAARTGDVETVKKLIDAGVDINAVSDYGVSSLALACDHGHQPIVELLLAKGANPNTKDRFYKFTPLGWAVMRNHPQIAKLLIDANAEEIETAFFISINSKSEAIVTELVRSKRLSESTLLNGLKMALASKSDSIAKVIDEALPEELRTKAREVTPPTTSEQRAPTDEPASEKLVESDFALSDDYPVESPNWPQFRGTLSRGIGGQAIPTQWNAKESTNIAWKSEIPGLGTSSPICWDNQVFVTTAVQADDASGFRVGHYGDVESVSSNGECQYLLLSFDLNTGKQLWSKELKRSVPKVKRHAKSSHANCTPATDGKYVIAFFGGEGIYCCDRQGNLIWERQLGLLDSGWFYDRTYQWGFGSSPCIFEDMVILQCDCQDGSFIVALDLATGAEKWRTERNEIPSWGSPVAFIAPDGRPTVITSGTKCSAAYDARTGEELWKLGGFSEIVVPTPQITRDMTILASGYAPVRPIVALKHSARGELSLPADKESKEPFIWSMLKGGPYMPTPLVYQGKLFVLDNTGILCCYNLANGQRVFRQRVRADEADAFTSSPVAADGKIYLTSENGITFVCQMDDTGTILEKNQLGESVLSSPAIAGSKLLIRGEKHLFAIGEASSQ